MAQTDFGWRRRLPVPASNGSSAGSGPPVFLLLMGVLAVSRWLLYTHVKLVELINASYIYIAAVKRVCGAHAGRVIVLDAARVGEDRGAL
ncbi:hypothetical protein GCM10022207_55210 [Streptomyces lannensis]|uniref:Uncharacterized protein n=1 Tax=Streptomyces lannensis TaxID=766498 RepID=A0ABP7KPB6_9ACTN